jgi:hypothetical protein
VQQLIDIRAQKFMVSWISIVFCKLFFYLLTCFVFQETCNTRLYERYEKDSSTHRELNLDLWLDVGSTGGPNKNQVYSIFNTTIKDMWVRHNVSTIRTLKSRSSQQSSVI